MSEEHEYTLTTEARYGVLRVTRERADRLDREVWEFWRDELRSTGPRTILALRWYQHQSRPTRRHKYACTHTRTQAWSANADRWEKREYMASPPLPAEVREAARAAAAKLISVAEVPA